MESMELDLNGAFTLISLKDELMDEGFLWKIRLGGCNMHLMVKRCFVCDWVGR
jgi:hypothetical protein